MVEADSATTQEAWELLPIMERFHAVEKEVLGFENYINCDDDHYLGTLEKLRLLVTEIQKEALFSDNEELKEIETDHVR